MSGEFAPRPFAPGEFIFLRHHSLVATALALDDLLERECVQICELGFDRFGVLAPLNPGSWVGNGNLRQVEVLPVSQTGPRAGIRGWTMQQPWVHNKAVTG